MKQSIAQFSARYRDPIIIVGLFAVLTVLFVLAPWSGDDWETFYGAGKRVLHHDSLYGTRITHAYYSNPPWLAVLFAPLALLPEDVGWAMISAGTLLAILALLLHWQPDAGVAKGVLAMTSPATFYIFLHGQIDVLVIALVMLPAQWWVLVALSKPQVAIGLAAGIPPRLWVRAALLTAVIIGVSLLWFGLWPLDLFDQPSPFKNANHNLWVDLWPFEVPVGVGLLVAFWPKRDERLLVACSPFLSPYAALSSMVGPWLVALTYLTTWQAALVWASWWGAVVYRLL